MLAVPIAALAILYMSLATITYTLNSSAFSMRLSQQIAFQAEQYAEVDANTLKLIDYDDVDDYVHPRQAIDLSKIITAAGWEDEISITPETVVDVATNTRQRVATIKIYKEGDTLSRCTVDVPLSTKGRGGFPVGSIIAWPIASDPLGVDADNWLECNGQAINVTKYPKLAKLMGTVPDYRGLFLRGLGGNSSVLGNIQGDTIRNITGSISFEADNFNGSSGAISGNSAYGTGYMRAYGASIYDTEGHLLYAFTAASGSMFHSMSFDASQSVPTANENRPINKAVRYLIKAR